MRRSLTLLPSLLLWALPSAVWGQIPDSLRADTSRTPVYEVRGVTIMVPRPVSTTGGASAVAVNLDSMMVTPAPTLEQVLREMPLIQIRRNSRGEAQPAMRGGEDRQIGVVMDGVPLTLGWDARTDLSVVPLAAARNLNLIRGLSSILHGPNILGGVVEVDIARGADRQQAPRPFQADLGLDQTGALKLGLAAGRRFEGNSGSWVVRGGVGHQARDGFALSDDAEEEPGLSPNLLTEDGDLRLNTDESRVDGFVSVRHLSDSGRWFSLSSTGFSLDRGVAPEAHVEDPRLWRYPSQTRLVTAISGGTGQRQTPFGEGDLEATLGLDFGSTDIEQFSSPSYEEIVGSEDGDDRTLTLRLLGDHSLGTRGEFRTALTLADVSHEEVLDGVEENRYRQRLWSLGTEVEWGFDGIAHPQGPSGTRLTAGFAVDGADTPETAGKPDLGRLWDWGGRLGLTTLVAQDRVLLHGALSRRTRFPALRELYSGALGRFLPNPELKPEVLTGGEAGMTLTGLGVDLQGVFFHQRITNGIIRSSVTTPEGRKFQRVNEDEIRSTGLELLASGALGPLALSGDVTFQKVRGINEDGDEQHLEYEPAVAGKLSASLPLIQEFQASATARFLSSQYCENSEMGGLESFDGSGHLDLGLQRTFQVGGGAFSSLETALRLDNATDGLVMDQCGLPLPGRTLRLQLRIW
jgi:iron complex outermembrane receptor protein